MDIIGRNGVVVRRGGGGGGGFRGIARGGFRGGFHRGFRRGGFVTSTPFWDFGYPYYYPYSYGYYGYPYYGYPYYGTTDTTQMSKTARDAYTAWQQAIRAGASPDVIQDLKEKFERALF